MTRQGKAKVVLVVGLAALGFGVKNLVDLYTMYTPKFVAPTLAFVGGGAIVVAIALALLKRPLVGVAVVVAAAGASVAAIKLGQAGADERMRGYEREAEIGEAAEKVCDGVPNAGAAPPSGPRKLMQVYIREGSGLEKLKIPHVWEGLPAPRSGAELQIVACIDENRNYTASCEYADANGAPSYTIHKYQHVDRVTVRDAKTAAVLGEQTFEGSVPSDRCDESIRTTSSSGTSRDSGGDPPDRAAETAFVRRFVEPAEN
jgi:hypothetical protein